MKYYVFSCTTIVNTTNFAILHEILPNQESERENLGPVRVCRFSPDGKMLAKGHDTGVIEVGAGAIAILNYRLLKFHKDQWKIIQNYPTGFWNRGSTTYSMKCNIK